MNRINRVLMTIVLASVVALPGFGMSFGGSISFFVPESLVVGEVSGSVSKEAGLSYSLGLGDYISIPAGFTYIKASGLLPYEKNSNNVLHRSDKEIWYTADTFIPYLRIETHIPMGPVFVEGFAGAAGGWFIAPQMNEGAIGRTYGDKDSDGYDYYVFDDLSMNISLGYGYQAGGSIGVEMDQIRVKLNGSYTDIIAKTTVKSGTYYKVDYDGSTAKAADFEESFTSRLRGFSVGIGGSYQM